MSPWSYTFSLFLFFFVFSLHCRPPRHCLIPLWVTVFHPDESREKRREGWQTSLDRLRSRRRQIPWLLRHGDNSARTKCPDRQRTFSIIHISKIPILKVLNHRRSGQFTAVARRVKSSPATHSKNQVDNFKPTRAGRVKLFWKETLVILVSGEDAHTTRSDH